MARSWASPAQPSPNQLSPARPGPSLGVGLAKALPKPVFFYNRIQTSRFRPTDGSVFGPFSARLGPPCRCVWLFWRVRFWFVPGAPKCRPAESSARLSPAQPSPDQLSPARPGPTLAFGLAKALPKPFFLQDSDVPFSAPRRLRFWSVFGLFGATVPLCLAVLEGPFLVRCWASPAQPSPNQLSPARPGPSLGVGLAKALPKPFFTGFRRPVFGPQTAPFLVRFWPVWGHRAAAFGCFGGFVFGSFLARQSAAQPRLSWVDAGVLGVGGTRALAH